MRTIVVLLIAALVLTPTLANAQVNGGLGYVGLAILLLPVLLILLLMDGDEEYPRVAVTPSPLPGPPSESQASPSRPRRLAATAEPTSGSRPPAETALRIGWRPPFVRLPV